MVTKAMADGVYTVPFVDDFDGNTKREQFTTIDANHDGVTWKRHYKQSILPGFYPDTDFHEMEYDSGAASQDADDWFITPKIHLEAGKVYSFAFNAYVGFDSFVHQVEVKMGQGVTVADMRAEVLKSTTVSSSSPETFEQEFAVEQDGDYNIGIHITSQPDKSSFYFTHLVVKQTSNDAAPARISDLQVQPDPAGKLSATVCFTAPSKTLAGDELASLTKMELSRNGSLIKTFTGIAPGESVSYVDNGPVSGFNSYTVIPYGEHGKGIRAQLDSVYVGVDRPLPPTNFRLTDCGSSVQMRWDKVAPKGCNGMVVDTDAVTYIVEAMNSSYSSLGELTRTMGLEYSYALNTLDGQQDLKRFGIRAANSMGWSDFAYARLVVGCPYNLPYRESFATGTIHGLVWQEGEGTYSATTADAADGDAGSIQFKALAGQTEVSLNLAKMSMQQAQHPVMKFQYKGLVAGAGIIVCAERQNGTRDTLCVLDEPAADWTPVTVDLQQFVGENYIIPKFLTKNVAGATVLLDDIQLLDLYDADLSIQLEAETREDGFVEATATLTNEGMTEAEGYAVLFTLDGKEVARVVASEALAAGHQAVLTATFPFQAQADDQAELKAAVQWVYDLCPDNDLASVQVVARKAALGTAEDATALAALFAAGRKVDIHATDGRLVRRDATSLEGLKKGVYIIGEKKICVTR